VSLAQEPEIERQPFGRFEHAVDVPFTGGAGGCARPIGWSGPAANHRGDAAVKSLPGLLRTDEVNVRIDSACSQDAMLTGDDLGRRPDFEAWRDIVLNVGIARLSDRGNTPVANPDVGLDDSPVVEQNGVGN